MIVLCGEGNGNPLQYSCLWNPMDRGAWWASLWGCKRIRRDLVTKQQQQQYFALFQSLFQHFKIFLGLFFPKFYARVYFSVQIYEMCIQTYTQKTQQMSKFLTIPLNFCVSSFKLQTFYHSISVCLACYFRIFLKCQLKCSLPNADLNWRK